VELCRVTKVKLKKVRFKKLTIDFSFHTIKSHDSRTAEPYPKSVYENTCLGKLRKVRKLRKWSRVTGLKPNIQVCF